MVPLGEQEHGREQGELHEQQDPPDEPIAAINVVAGGLHEMSSLARR